ncbi:DUF4253 domain-containing protein [Actinospica robiniae]|uniref:DUF4253 domain-containing protein n=1 Tax=Actinospica robiniae TaxID=304901 RepID=UPI0003F80EA9|nr:DUF4253 domain-containing protein [Actinospica robiniae]
MAGRISSAKQVREAVWRLRRGDCLVLPCAADEDCYAQVMLTLQGVYQVEYRVGSPDQHFQTRSLSAEAVGTILAAWIESLEGWQDAFSWKNIGAMFADAASGEAAGIESVDVDGLLASATVRGALPDGREVRSVPVGPAQAVLTWQALRAAHDRTGLWPFLADPPAERARPEVWAHLLDDVRTEGRPPEDRDDLFVSLLAKTIGPDDDDRDEEERKVLRDALRCEQLVLRPRPVSRVPWARATRQIGLCPAAVGGWDIPELMGWEGAVNFAISGAEHSAVLETWHRRYGAELMALTFDTVELWVPNPPTDPGEVASVALEQVAYCPDAVFQGAGSVTALAEQQVYSDTWSFWWD